MSTSTIKLFGDFDEYLLQLWFKEVKNSNYVYREPFLDSTTVDLVKHLCNTLKQDSHVFVMSIDLLLQYIAIQNSKEILIENQLLVIVCTISICNKHVGDQSDLRPIIVAKLYTNMTEQIVSIEGIRKMEMHILRTLQYKLPLHSRVDDLKTFLAIYLKRFKLRVDIIGVCVQILDLIYIYYRRLFYKLKNIYKQNSDALLVFENLITNRMYLPCGILMCAINMTKLKHFMSKDEVLQEISQMCGIHTNHIDLLCDYITNIISTSGNSSTSNL